MLRCSSSIKTHPQKKKKKIIFTCRRLIHWYISMQRPINSKHARKRTESMWKRYILCVNVSVLPVLRTSNTNKFLKALSLCHRMAKCWHNSACNCEIVSNISLQSAVCHRHKQLENVNDIHKGGRSESK